MTFLPHIFSNLTVGVLIVTDSITHIILKFPFIDLSVLPSKLPPSLLYIIKINALKLVSIKRLPKTFSLSLAIHELSLINTTIFPLISP